MVDRKGFLPTLSTGSAERGTKSFQNGISGMVSKRRGELPLESSLPSMLHFVHSSTNGQVEAMNPIFTMRGIVEGSATVQQSHDSGSDTYLGSHEAHSRKSLHGRIGDGSNPELLTRRVMPMPIVLLESFCHPLYWHTHD